MLDRQALFEKLLGYLQSTPTPPEYLGAESESAETFDPYQMVSEWIALRQEMKQQGKLLQATQQRLQRELEGARSQNEQLQQRLEASQKQVTIQYATELAAQEKRFEKDLSGLLRSLLGVLDALDRACAHWQEQLETLPRMPEASESPKTVREKLARWLASLSQKLSQPENLGTSLTPASVSEILTSDRLGVELIRQDLLDILKQQQVVPISAQGQPFDPQWMYALGRQESEAPENTVIQEVVRGYLWRDQVLREAQVIVSSGRSDLHSITLG